MESEQSGALRIVMDVPDMNRFLLPVILLVIAAGCAEAQQDGADPTRLETTSYVNIGLEHLLRVDLHEDAGSRRIFGTLSVVEYYSDREEDRHAYGFIGERHGNRLVVSFGGELPYAVSPEAEESGVAVWHVAVANDGKEIVEIETYGRRLDSDEWTPYVMQLDRLP